MQRRLSAAMRNPHQCSPAHTQHAIERFAKSLQALATSMIDAYHQAWEAHRRRVPRAATTSTKAGPGESCDRTAMAASLPFLRTVTTNGIRETSCHDHLSRSPTLFDAHRRGVSIRSSNSRSSSVRSEGGRDMRTGRRSRGRWQMITWTRSSNIIFASRTGITCGIVAARYQEVIRKPYRCRFGHVCVPRDGSRCGGVCTTRGERQMDD